MSGIHGTTQQNKNHLRTVNYEVLLHKYSFICVNFIINYKLIVLIYGYQVEILNEAALLRSSCTVFFSVAYLRMRKYTYQVAQLSQRN